MRYEYKIGDRYFVALSVKPWIYHSYMIKCIIF